MFESIFVFDFFIAPNSNVFLFKTGDKGDRGILGPKGLNGICLDSQKGEVGPKGEKGKSCEPNASTLPPGIIYIKGQAGEKGDKGMFCSEVCELSLNLLFLFDN